MHARVIDGRCLFAGDPKERTLKGGEVSIAWNPYPANDFSFGSVNAQSTFEIMVSVQVCKNSMIMRKLILQVTGRRYVLDPECESRRLPRLKVALSTSSSPKVFIAVTGIV
jgi:hypothetical protein